MRVLVSLMFCAVFVVAGAVFGASAYGQEAVKMVGQELLPPNAQPGECYARVFVPPAFRTVTESVLKREASEKLITEEPKFEFVDEQIMVKAPSEKVELIPAQYDWVEEQVLVYPEHTHLEEVPAVYGTVSEQVLDQPARTEWKKGRGLIQKIDNATGEIMCLVNVPATYKTITKRVLKTPATTREVTTPAKYTTVRKRVMTKPPETRKIEIPAEYKTVKVRKMVSPATVNKIAIPEEFQTVSRRELVTEGRMEWRAVLCETNATPGLISSLQSALLSAGFDPGPIDGRIGNQTMSALASYQKSKSLPEGEITIGTLKSLGIDMQ